MIDTVIITMFLVSASCFGFTLCCHMYEKTVKNYVTKGEKTR